MDTADQSAVMVRAGRPADVGVVHQAIVALARHVGGEGDVTSTPDDLLRGCFGENPACFMAIAEIGGAFAGMCLHFPIFSTWMGGAGVYVQDLFVDPVFRGRGVGERLLRHVARLSRRKGGIYLRLAVDTDNYTAQTFYTRLGIGHSDYEQVHKITGDAFLAFCDDEERP